MGEKADPSQQRLNAAQELVDSHINLGRGAKAAILCGEQTVSYADLHQSVNRVGNALLDMGVRREDRVAILSSDRPEWAFAFFAAIKIGAVAVPLNTKLTSEDCQYVINDSRARVLCVDRGQLDRLAKIRAALSHVEQVIVIGDEQDDCVSLEEIQRTCSATLPAADTSQDDMAFWLYSSGTTAVPKAAIHCHRSMIVAADRYAQGTIGLRETDVSFSVAKLFFAYGLGNGLYFPLRCGGTTVLLPDDALPETVFAVCDRHQPTVLYSVPTSYAGLLHTAEMTGRTSLGRIRMCISAGEPLPKLIFEKWRERFGVEILDGIGSTEMLHIYISNRPGRARAGSTGNLVPGYEARILGEDGNEVSAGVVGRLLVKGDSAAAGYWNRDDDTRETFRGEWLDTHDSFKVDQDGFYWYAGRSDDMFKVSGYAVWPARVESILQGHPAVVECAVAGVPGPDGLITPRADVVLKQGYQASPELARQLQHFASSNASPHECPQQVTFVAQLPKTATGKIQRHKLHKTAPPDAHVIRWQPHEPLRTTEAVSAGTWLVVGDEEAVLTCLVDELESREQRCVMAFAAPGQQYSEMSPGRFRLDTDASDQVDRLLTRVLEQDGVALHAVVWLATNANDSLESVADEQQHQVGRVVHLIQTLHRRAVKSLPGGLHLATCAAVAVETGEDVSPGHSALWGLGRAIAAQHPQLHCALIDLEPGDANVARLVDHLLDQRSESQMALRTGRWHVPRIVPQSQDERLPVPKQNFQLTNSQPGVLERLELTPIEVSQPAAGQVQVRVRAAGINFRDLLHALNMLPGTWGSELAGDVVAVGEGVSHLSVGDRVFGFADGAFGDLINTEAVLMARLPRHVSYASGATIPTAFSTAGLAFRLAGLKEGQRVLIHAASGGVGLAAVQLAFAAGAQVFATASEPKQAFLRSLGVAHVFDSRSTGFSEAVVEASGGQGVDVVLNSLTGEGFIEATLGALSPGGCFVELGKRNIWSAGQMRQQRPDVDYRILTLGEPTEDESQSRGALLTGIAVQLERGELTPLHHRVYPLAAAGDAFRRMQQARHIGKLVLSVPANVPSPTEATYLITGGFSSFGVHAAHALADQGARHFVFVAMADPGEAAEAKLRRLRELGCQVDVRQADVSRFDEVEAIVRGIDERFPPLRGVIHGVGVSSDHTLVEQSWRQLEESLSNTLRGAWHLHRVTSQLPLDFFVLCSSASSVLAPAHHTTDAIATAYLGGLAHHRQASGLPALSVHWDPPAGGSAGGIAGQVVGSEQAESLPPECWAGLLGSGEAVGFVLDAGWEHRMRSSGSDQATPLLQFQADGLRSRHEKSDAFKQISRKPPARRLELLASHLQLELARILYLPEPPALDAGFNELGLHSLLAVEFRDLLQSQFGDQVTLSSTLAFDYPSVNQLARHLVGQLWPRSQTETKRERRRLDPSEPLAVVGLACRFPGAPDSEAFWQLLDQGVDAVGEVPAERWDVDARYDPDPDKPGKMSTRYGGFLRKVDCFDAELFGISAREAARMDPQHRLLLEVGWEALENAGISGRKLVGSNSGVFIGISSSDYAQLTGGDLDRMDFYDVTGGGPAYAAGRLSHFFGLHGPSQVVDTTCSSSLVSVHQACQSLRSGECDLALAGGVNLILTPDTYVFLSRAKALAPDGRCKTFDAAADGFSRAEGCGLVVLKRWSDARRDGDRILALIRGSAVTHDGPSGGLTVPHGPSQQRVIRNALRQAGCKPGEVSYLEAHGTGTKLGDPIEVQAAAAVFGRGRSAEQPLLIGSVKTNIGHLEAAAGIAGLIKVVLAMQHGVIPRQLHFEQPNPHIPWDGLPIRVSSQAEPWPSPRRLAGVSAFGFSGTNAHVLLEGPPAGDGLPAPKRPERPHHLLVLSADREDALRELAGRYSSWLEKHPQASLENVCFSASTGRSHLEQRAALVAQSSDQLKRQLAHLQMGQQTEGLLTDRAASKLRTAWVFAGQGSQYAGMGRELYQTEPGFREVFDTCAEMLAGRLERPLQEAVFEDMDLLDQATYAEPALFALEMALARLWQDWGVEPDAVVGHGIGQYAAACVAGALPLEDGLQLVAKRAELTSRLPPGGAMVESDLDEFGAFAARMAFQPAERTLICTLTGQPVADGDVLDAGYWRRHTCEPEQFEASLATLADSGVGALLEIGPQPMPQEMGGRAWPTQGAPTVVSSLRPGMGDVQQMVEALAALYVQGVTPDFEAFDRPWSREKISLPSYPFQRQRYWVDTQRRTELAGNPPTVNARVEELLYEVQWQVQSRGDANAGFLDTPAEIKGRTERAVDPPGSATQHLVDPAWRADLDDLSCRYVLEAFQRLGGPWAPGERVDLDTLAEAWGVDVGYRQKLLNRLLSVLGNAGWIDRDETQFHLPPQWPPTEADQRQLALHQQYPWAEIELTLLGRCGDRIDEALTGKADPLELLFPKHGLGAHDLYRESSDAAAGNLGIRKLFEQAIASLPSGRRLRVLEIGAGTGGTTASVLPVLPATRCDYVYTDVTSGFFASAAQQFARYPFVSYRTLDAERDPESQGFRPHQFDIVLASNVLHATRDIEESVRHVRQLLAPGGCLVLLELVHPRAWLDATFGLLEGWWRFDDRLRSNHALLDIEGWRRVLSDEGFTVESLDTGGSADQALFLAQAPFQLPASDPGADRDLAPWLILADRDGVGDSLAEMFRQRGLACRILQQDDADDLSSGFDDVLTQPGVPPDSPLNIVHLWNLDIGSAPGAESIRQAERSALITASLMQAVERCAGQARLWFVTRGSQSVLENESTAPQQALLWGMASVACLEMPGFCHGQIDLPLEVGTADLEMLRDTLLDAGSEDKLAIRGDGLHVARVAPMSPSHPTQEFTLGDDESYLISGGLGHLGLQTAQWLAEQGAKHLILNTRKPLPDTGVEWNSADPVLRQRIQEVESLRQAGVAVHILAADVSDAEALRAAWQRLDVPPLRGVIHAGGTHDFRQISQWSSESLRTALAAKVHGAWNLHELTADSDLRFFVNFSSAASVWGAHGQGAYAAANAFLDTLAHYRRADGLPALSVNWARWSIGATTEEHHQSMQATGLRSFRPAEGLAALGQLLTRCSAQAIVADVDWGRFKAVYESRNERRLFAEITATTPGDESDDGSVLHSGLVDRLRSAEPSEQTTLMVAHLQQVVSEVLGNSTTPDLDKGFFDLGVDSLMAVEIRNRIESSLGADPPLPSSLVFNHPTIRELAGHLVERSNRSAGLPDKPASPVAAGELHRDLQEPLAIIGLGCQFPGAANVEAYWSLLREGRDAVGAVPSDRWETRREGADVPDIDCGGFLDGVGLFDPMFFGISPKEAAHIDPQQRLLLEVSWDAFEHAAIPVGQLAGAAVGVFVGISQMDYGHLLYQRESDLGIHAVTGIPLSAAAGRLSYTFGFKGPALALDTACSSSLTAVHQACNSLRLRECDTALAAGVNIIATPRATRELAKAGMLSPDGRCKTFDDSADGFGRGEGCGVVLLKRLSDAQRDGNPILAVIRGSACNHDGATSGFTVPSGPSQERVIAAAVRQASVRPETVDYLEAHGTGTRLGDPIEVQAAAEVLGAGRPPQQPLLIGSVKTNLGHLEAAAGIAGLIKVVLAMQNRLIPKQLHFKNPSSHIPWDLLPVKVVDEATPWPQQTHPPLAGVSSMGASGTNVHVILEGPPLLPRPWASGIRDRSHHILTLSAKTPQALRELAERYLQWLDNHADAQLPDVCHAAATGRSHFQHRAALVVSSLEETRSRLESLLANRPAPGMVLGEATLLETAASCWPDDQAPTRIGASFGNPDTDYELCLAVAKMHVSGANVKWAEWDAPWPRQRPSLPTYPFQRKRYWLPPLQESTSPPPKTTTIASEYYDALTTSVLAPDSLFGPGKIDDAFLTFVPFPEIVPGFSWIRTFAFPEDENNAEHRALVFREQQHMRRILFRHVDFASCQRALDFGCGYGSDLIRLGNQHPHLKIDGFTISARQQEIIAQKIAGEELQSRVRVFHRDSSRDDFLERYDLVFGIEVACHIKNKDALFRNIADHLGESGTLVLADFISMAQFAVDDPSTSSYLITQEEWAQLLSRRELEVVECVDAGEEVANSLYEPERAETLRELNRRVSDSNVNRGIESYVQLGEMLRKGLMRYVLLTVRQATSTGSELLRANQAALSRAVPYRDLAPHRWLYDLEWQAQESRSLVDVADTPAAEPGSQCASGTWLVLGDRGGVGRALTTALEQGGGSGWLVEAGSAWQQVDERHWKLPPNDHTAFARLVREIVDKTGTPLAGVVHLWSLDDRPPGELTLEHLSTDGESGAKSVLPLLQTLVHRPETGEPKFWLVTRGAMVPARAELPDSLAASCVWGLGRVFSLEYSHLWGGLIDLPASEAADKQVELVMREILGGSEEDQVAYDQCQRHVPRLVHSTVSPASPFKAEADATYLVTGGLGALGGQVAQWLLGCGARNLVLCGRQVGHDAQARWTADHPEAAGCKVRLLSADVAREEDVQQLLQTIQSGLPPLRGVVHAAGVIGNEQLAQMTVPGWDEVLRPKVQGSWNLHALTEQLPLDFFVCFSSIAAIWGSAGQAHYAAANAFLDALCRYRHLLGLPALSINWGPITGGGMLDSQSQTWLQERGVQAMTPAEALEVLELLLGGDASQTVAAKVDWPRFKMTYESARRRPLLDCLGHQDEMGTSQDMPCPSAFVQRLRDVPARQRLDLLQAYVRQQIAAMLGFSPEQIAPRQGLFDVGMDSLNAVELRHRFNTDMGVDLPSTLLFDHPTVESLVGYLSETLPMAESVIAQTETGDPSQLAADADLARSLEDICDMDENDVRKSLEGGSE